MQKPVNNNFKESLLHTVDSLRKSIRSGEMDDSTSGLVPGLVQANIVILPKIWAHDFLLFCQKNPIACPLIDVFDAGQFLLKSLGKDIDVRTDIPEYCVFVNGVKTEVKKDISDLWQDDFVVFALGCSFSFEYALQQAGLSIANLESNRNVSMYETNVPTNSVGVFQGNVVVSMRPFTPAQAIKAIQITSQFPLAHGAPIHIGKPEMIGIHSLSNPSFGDAVEINEEHIPVFWGCGVTPQVVINNANIPMFITHAPGKMLITDKLYSELR